MTLLLLSTADTDLLAARAVEDPALPLRLANPVRLSGPVDLTGVALVVVRLLGGRRAWDGLDGLVADCAAARVPLVALGGEGSVDAELTTLSTVPSGVVADAAAYLREGGTENLRELVAFLSDTVLLTGHGFAPPAPLPGHGVHGDRALDPARPTVGVVFYRAHALSGNTAFVDVLCDAVEAAGANALPVYVASLRPGRRRPGRRRSRSCSPGRVDSLVVTVLAGGGSNASDTEGWDARALAALDVPVLQGLCVTSSRAVWEASDAGLAPIDAAMQVAIPEFDGRLIGAAVLVQGGGAGRRPELRRRPRAGRPRRRRRRVARPAAPHAERGEEGRARPVELPDQAQPGRQRRRPGHPGVGRADAAGDARRRLHGGGVPRGRRRAGPHAHRRGRPRRRVADRGADVPGGRAGAAGGVPAVVRRAADRPARGDGDALGPAARPALRRRRRASRWRPCSSATSC